MTAMPSKEIDGARVGLSKTLMTTPCALKGYYGERVRDEHGRRLRFPMPERVTFGSAVDEAILYILWHDRDGLPWDVGTAVAMGMSRATTAEGWRLVPDMEAFHTQLDNAIWSYTTSPDGLVRMQALYGEGLLLQGNDGESLRAGDVIGTPDAMTSRRVIDVKTWGRRKADPARLGDELAAAKTVWGGVEMAIYAYLFAKQNGEVPESVAYQAYIRSARPYWLWVEAPGTPELVGYGAATARRWRALLAADDPDLFTPDTTSCHDCGYRDALPQYGHDGCHVGRLLPVLTTEEGAA